MNSLNSLRLIGTSSLGSRKTLSILMCVYKMENNYETLKMPELKGTSGRKKSEAQMKEREKCKKNEPLPTSMRQMVLEIFHFKVRNLGKMDIAIL